MLEYSGQPMPIYRFSARRGDIGELDRESPGSAPGIRPSGPSSGRKPSPSLRIFRRIAVFFVLLAAGMVALAAYVVLARASVVVMSKQEPVAGEFLVDIAPEPTDGEIPGGVFTDSASSETKVAAASLVRTDQQAEGRVKITSSLSRPQTLLATTRLLTPAGILYRTRQTVTVPAFGSAEADIFAVEPGKDGEAESMSFTIPGLNEDTRKRFTVETIGPITGGYREIKVVTAEGIAQAVESLKKRLIADLEKRLEDEAGKKVPVDGRLITSELTSQSSDQPPGAEAPEYTVAVAVRSTAEIYDKQRFHQAVEAKLAELVPTGRKLLRLSDDDTAVALDKSDIPGGRANLRVQAKGIATLDSAAQALQPGKIVGITAEAAKKYLEKLDGVASASVSVSPFLPSRLPSLAKNIKIEVR